MKNKWSWDRLGNQMREQGSSNKWGLWLDLSLRHYNSNDVNDINVNNSQLSGGERPVLPYNKARIY